MKVTKVFKGLLEIGWNWQSAGPDNFHFAVTFVSFV